jgi:hypothetical protein
VFWFSKEIVIPCYNTEAQGFANPESDYRSHDLLVL